MYLSIFVSIVAVIMLLLAVTFVYAKKKDKKANEMSKVVEYYKTTDTRCLNCAYSCNIRNNHVCTSKLTPHTEECENTYKERESDDEVVKTDPQVAMEILCQYFLGNDWKTDNCTSVKEINTVALIQIMEQYHSKKNENISLTKKIFKDFVTEEKPSDKKSKFEKKDKILDINKEKDKEAANA